MGTFSNSSGMATSVVDFTSALSPLLIGLVSLLCVSAGMITLIAIRHYLSQQSHPTPQGMPTALDYRKAA